MQVLIWGTGQMSWNVTKMFSNEDIIGYVDTYATSKEFAGKPLYTPQETKDMVYDAILVATLYGEEIMQVCIRCGISLDKVIFVYGNMVAQDMNRDYKFVSKICGKKNSDIIKNRYHLVREIDRDCDANKKEFEVSDYKNDRVYRNDYIRLKVFELLADVIKRENIEGQIAELGVFKGEFAKFLNYAFPERKLYLFDTFDGFDEEELSRDVKDNGICAVREIYKKTSIDTVMDKMRYKENVIIKQGLFPESLDGLDEKFAFVSLDCDFEESIYQGLKYFYPNITGGGYIMLHDYNNFIGCAKKALERYENDMDIKIHKVPICDAQGSLVITK